MSEIRKTDPNQETTPAEVSSPHGSKDMEAPHPVIEPEEIGEVQEVGEMGRLDPQEEAVQKAEALSPHRSRAMGISNSVMKPEENRADSQALTNVMYVGGPEGADTPSPKNDRSRFHSGWTWCAQNTLEPDACLQDPLAELPVQDGARNIEHQLATDLAGTFATDIKSI